MSRDRELSGNWGYCCIRMSLKRLHQLLQPKPSFPSQSWRPKPISKWQLWKPRQTVVVQSKQLRQPIPKPSARPEPWKTSQAVMFHEEHGKYMEDLEEQAFGEESSCHNILSSCQPTLSHSPQLLRGALATLYHLLLGQALPSPPPILPPRISPVEEQPSTATPPTSMPKQSQRPNRQHPLPEPMGNVSMGGATPTATLGGPPSPKK